MIDEAIQEAPDEGRTPTNADIQRAVKGNEHHHTRFTGENEWDTPTEYIEAARTCLGGIDLDPATALAAQRIIRAARYYTIDDDGLKQEWRRCVWLNPPYAQRHIVNFVGELLAELDAGRTREAIMLTHNYTDIGWFHTAAKRCIAICFTRERIRFVSPDGKLAAPTQGQVFFYFGPHCDRFHATFGSFGFIP